MYLYNCIEFVKESFLHRILGIPQWMSFLLGRSKGAKKLIWHKPDSEYLEVYYMDNNAVIRAQGYAVSIEHDMSRVFGCERFGFAGVVNSDFIRGNPLAAILATCGFIYAQVSEENKTLIEKFIEDTTFYWKMSLDKLLSFETSSKTFDIETIELNYENGEKALVDIMDKFSAICDLVE